MATKRVTLILPELLNEMEDLHHTLRSKLERALKIVNDQEAVRRILREMKELL